MKYLLFFLVFLSTFYIQSEARPFDQTGNTQQRPHSNPNEVRMVDVPVQARPADSDVVPIESLDDSTPLVKQKSKKEVLEEDLRRKGWQQGMCMREYCIFTKGSLEKHVFHDGRVEDISRTGTESINGILADIATKKPVEQPTQRHGFRYVNGQQRVGIPASQLAGAVEKEKNDKGTTKVLITFGTTWCGPCKNANSVLSKVSSTSFPGITAIKVLVDEQNSPTSTTVPRLAKFPHAGYPTAYVISKNANGEFDFSTIKNVNIIGKSAAEIFGGL